MHRHGNENLNSVLRLRKQCFGINSHSFNNSTCLEFSLLIHEKMSGNFTHFDWPTLQYWSSFSGKTKRRDRDRESTLKILASSVLKFKVFFHDMLESVNFLYIYRTSDIFPLIGTFDLIFKLFLFNHYWEICLLLQWTGRNCFLDLKKLCMDLFLCCFQRYLAQTARGSRIIANHI